MNLLQTEDRDLSLSKGELMKFRAQGKIPSIIFGGNANGTPVFVKRTDFEKMYSTHGKVFELEFGGKKQMVNTKEIQKGPLGNVLLHVAFHKLTKGQKTKVSVPVKTIGDAPGVKVGGNIAIALETIALQVLPSNVPHWVEIDISKMNIGDHILAGDIKLPKGATLDQHVDTAANVVLCHAPQKVVEEEVTTTVEVEAVTEEEKTEA